MQKSFFKRVSLVLFFALFPLRSLTAANVAVAVLNSSFSPTSLQINVGDTVIWTNQDDNNDSHTATSDNGAWSGGLMVGTGDQFSHTFPSVGTNNYHDVFNNFIGQVIVGNPPAAITLSSFKMLSGQFQFDISGLTVGKTNFILASTNLISWTPLRTNVATLTTSSFSDTQTVSFSPRFYRVQQLP